MRELTQAAIYDELCMIDGIPGADGDFREGVREYTLWHSDALCDVVRKFFVPSGESEINYNRSDLPHIDIHLAHGMTGRGWRIEPGKPPHGFECVPE